MQGLKYWGIRTGWDDGRVPELEEYRMQVLDDEIWRWRIPDLGDAVKGSRMTTVMPGRGTAIRNTGPRLVAAMSVSRVQSRV